MENLGSGEDKVRQTFEDLSRTAPVEPGTDPRSPDAERFEDSDLGQAAEAYGDALDDARQANASNDN